MSTVVTKNVQIGADGTASNNFTAYQPSTPDGTLRIGNGNSGSVTDSITLTSAGNVGIGTSSPSVVLNVKKDQSATTAIKVENANAGTGAVTNFQAAADVASLAIGVDSSTKTGTLFGLNRTSLASIMSFSDSALGVGTYGATPLVFGTSNTERMRIDSSGNVGIGTSTTGLEGVSLSNSYNVGWVQGSGESIPNIFRQASSAATIVANGYRQTNTANVFASSYSSSWAKSAIALNSGTVRFYTDTAAAVAAGTDVTPTERARIDSSGNLLVGKTSASYTSAGNTIFAGIINSAGTTDFWNTYNTSASAYRFYVSSGGTIFATSTTISAISDQRFKENVRDLDAGLTEIMALKPRLYDWKEGKGADIKNARGFIAQEFEEVFPDLIDEWKDPAPEGEEPYKSVRQDLIPVLVKAIQEQQATIASLTARIEALEGN